MTRILEWCAAAAAVLLALASLWRLLRTANRGLDFTDEGMYLLSADAQSRTASFHNAFGGYTRLLYELVGFDIARFRIVSELLLAVAAAGLGDRVAVASARLRRVKARTPVRIAMGAAICAAALHYYLLDLTTPSYNWLNLLGLLIISAGFLDTVTRPVGERRWWVRWAGPSLLAAGGAIATMGKASSGPVVVMLAAVGILVAANGDLQNRVMNLARAAVAAVAVLVVHTVVVNPPWVTVRQVVRGQRNLIELNPARYKLSSAMRDVERSFTTIRHGFGHVAGWGFAVVLVVAIAAAIWPRRGQAFVALVSMAAVVIVAARLFRLDLWAGGPASYSVLTWVSVVFLSVGLVFLPAVIRSIPRERGRAAIGFVTCLLVLVAAGSSYAFGSDNGFFNQLNASVALMAAAALLVLLGVCLPDGTPLPALALAIALGIGSYTVVVDALRDPYRQPPIDQQTTSISVGPHGGTLKLDPPTADFVSALRAGAARAGWVAGTPMLDFTPYSATTLYLLGAKPPLTILPSVGGYPATTKAAFWSMDQLVKAGWDAEFRRAWVLTQVGLSTPGPQPDTSALTVIGRQFPAQYELVGTFYLPRQGLLALWRPR